MYEANGSALVFLVGVEGDIVSLWVPSSSSVIIEGVASEGAEG